MDSFLVASAHLLDDAPWRSMKTAEIKIGPNIFFVYAKVPEGTASILQEVQKEVVPDVSQHQEIDHVTLAYVDKPEDGHPPSLTSAAVNAVRQVVQTHESIHVKVQGWAYFDGARKDGEDVTALVVLLDAPGLAALHVGIVNAIHKQGLPVSDRHGFVPHVTMGYLAKGGRATRELPPLSLSFDIEDVYIAAREFHTLRLGKGVAGTSPDVST